MSVVSFEFTPRAALRPTRHRAGRRAARRKGGALGPTASRSEEFAEEGEHRIGCCGECLDGAVSHSSGLVRLSDNEIEAECEKDEPR
jgi:hypothetical protein